MCETLEMFLIAANFPLIPDSFVKRALGAVRSSTNADQIFSNSYNLVTRFPKLLYNYWRYLTLFFRDLSEYESENLVDTHRLGSFIYRFLTSKRYRRSRPTYRRSLKTTTIIVPPVASLPSLSASVTTTTTSSPSTTTTTPPVSVSPPSRPTSSGVPTATSPAEADTHTVDAELSALNYFFVQFTRRDRRALPNLHSPAHPHV
eukprot:TRINITY_DN1446_c0_g1_i1.p1 TRINITY_DN1446_c0_g1~~TRINITY_DN1446_c0_g1_i1.p1  ORF type:complete len:215 (+),score=42.05 TRINITY_DN1446_c0_g1_i1:38-646(+)